MGLGLQQLPDHIARFVDPAEIDERYGRRSIAARQLRQRQDGASCPSERSFRMPRVTVANGESQFAITPEWIARTQPQGVREHVDCFVRKASC